MADAQEHKHAFLVGGGEMGARMRDHDWVSTPLGAPETWPQALRTMVSTMLNMPLLGAVLWGPDLILLYNDAYAPALLERHPAALGRPLREVWADVWEALAGPFMSVFNTGQGISKERFALDMLRHGVLERTFWNYSIGPIRDVDGRVVGLMNNAVEITAQVRAEHYQQVAEVQLREINAELRRDVTEREADFDRAWRLSHDLLAVARADGVLEAVNPLWTELLGWTERDLVGRSFVDFTHPDDLTMTLQVFAGILEAPLAKPYEYRLRHKDGTYRSVAWTATFEDGKVFATGSDVTRERAREAVLRDTQDFARLALSAVGGVGVWTYEVDADLFAYDEAIARLYALDPGRGSGGVPRAEFLANVHPDDRAALATTMAGGLSNAGDLELEYRLCHPDGSVHWVLSRGHTYHDDQGRPLRRTGVGVETTRQRQTEEALRQSQKMEAVGQLTGGLAHDFNNLLTGISGSLELMSTRISQGRFRDVDKYMAAAQTSTRRAAALTHRLLAFSRRQTLAPKPTDVNLLVSGMLDLVRRTVGPGVDVKYIDHDGVWAVLVDPPQLENALLNLCINARDAMPGGGRITIEAAHQDLDDGQAKLRDVVAGQYVTLSVSDNGSGMPPEVVAKAFDPFFTTKPLGEGTGLGLSMIYGFAKQSGGQARIYSEVGHGTIVRLYLPRHVGEGEVAGSVGLDASPVPRAKAGETVLIVDDEPTVRLLVTDVLQELGYITIEAVDGAGGLNVLQSSARVDLLVSDVGLTGGMNGRQMVDVARSSRPDLKVLFITGFAENALLNNGQLEPGMAVLTKPFAMDTLGARVWEMIWS